jgi:uracil-DNA glycosylase family 4
MNENPDCTLCELSKTCNQYSICLKGEGDSDAAKLVIFLDAPTIVEDRRKRSFVSQSADLVKWMVRRMSLSSEQVYLDYVLKCYPKANKAFGRKADRSAFIHACSVYRVATLQSIRPTDIVVMGSVACETFLHASKVSQLEGTWWVPLEPQVREAGVERVWVSFSPAYAIEKPAESPAIYRVIFEAARRIGLNPKTNPNIKPFDYGI